MVQLPARSNQPRDSLPGKWEGPEQEAQGFACPRAQPTPWPRVAWLTNSCRLSPRHLPRHRSSPASPSQGPTTAAARLTSALKRLALELLRPGGYGGLNLGLYCCTAALLLLLLLLHYAPSIGPVCLPLVP